MLNLWNRAEWGIRKNYYYFGLGEGSTKQRLQEQLAIHCHLVGARIFMKLETKFEKKLAMRYATDSRLLEFGKALWKKGKH